MNNLISKKPTTARNVKSRKLARLREQAEEAWNAADAAGERILSKGPNRQKWHRIKRRISRLEESFVHYQGRDIDAVMVNYMSGDITTTVGLGIESADERLFRTADGTYYLHREDDGRVYVHRLTLTAAALWAVTRANTTGLGLRQDVNRVFRAIKLGKEEA